MISGRELRRAELTSAGGRVVTMQVVRPAWTLDNLRQLKATSVLWKGQAAMLPEDTDAHFHAEFAAYVAWEAARSLHPWSEDPQHHIIVVGQDVATGDVLGINTAYWVEDEQAWYLAVGTTRPEDQPGYPHPDRLRGIGLELTGAIVGVMNEIVCAPVTLEPLDAAARRFWLARGFHNGAASEELRMSCPESRELEAKLAHSERDDPARGDAPFFTDSRTVPTAAFQR